MGLTVPNGGSQKNEGPPEREEAILPDSPKTGFGGSSGQQKGKLPAQKEKKDHKSKGITEREGSFI